MHGSPSAARLLDFRLAGFAKRAKAPQALLGLQPKRPLVRGANTRPSHALAFIRLGTSRYVAKGVAFGCARGRMQ